MRWDKGSGGHFRVKCRYTESISSVRAFGLKYGYYVQAQLSPIVMLKTHELFFFL